MDRRFEFSYNDWMRPLATLLGLGPKRSHVDVAEHVVRVRMGWGFRGRIDRSAIVRAEHYTGKVWSWGVHGWRGRWLVNGASDGLVMLEISPPPRASVMGIPVRLRELMVSLADPDGFLTAVRADR